MLTADLGEVAVAEFLDLVAEVEGFRPGCVGEVFAPRSVENTSAGVDDGEPAMLVASVADGGFKIASLLADSGDQDGQRRSEVSHGLELVGVSCADHEADVLL